jgi:hypothetical protein
MSTLTIKPERFAFYEKRVPEYEDKSHVGAAMFTENGVILIKQIRGMLGDEPNTIHKNRGINDFEDIPIPIPEGYKRVDNHSEDWIKKYFYNPNFKWVEPCKVPEYDQEHYFTHDNGGRPFVIYLSNDNVATVYRRPNAREDSYTRDEDWDNEEIRRQLYTKKVFQTKYESVFIGKSPRDEFTEWGGGYGRRFDGNSVLLHISGLEYVCVAESIKKFTALSPIVAYQSSVGNNDVPYPFAMDDQGRVYLMLDDVIMKPTQFRHPYSEYYDRHDMLSFECVNFKDKSYGDYKGFYIGDEPYNLNWNPDPNHFDVMNKDDDGNTVDMFLLKKDGSRQFLTKELYTQIMDEYAHEQGFSTFEVEEIHKRVGW